MSTEIGRDDLTLRILIPSAFDVLSVADDEFDGGVVVGEGVAMGKSVSCLRIRRVAGGIILDRIGSAQVCTVGL